MTADDTITRVTCRWDDQAGVEPAWYCESHDGSGPCDDSQKVWFPVSVDSYDQDEADQLAEALAEAFPEAEIVFI